MATTLNDLEALLDGLDLSYYVNAKNDSLVLPVWTDNDLLNVYVGVKEKGEFLLFRIPFFLSAAKAVNKGLLYENLLALNDGFKLGRFGLDRKDGEVCFEIGLPIEDSQLTARQLRRTISVFRHTVRKYREELRRLVETGVDPGQRVEECVRKLLGDEQSEDDQRSDAA